MPTYPKRPRAYVMFQIRLPPELKRQLEDYAFQTEQSQIAVVTAALEEFLHRMDKSAEKEIPSDDPPKSDP